MSDSSIRQRLQMHEIDKEFNRIKVRSLSRAKCRSEEIKEIKKYIAQRGQLPYYNRQH